MKTYMLILLLLTISTYNVASQDSTRLYLNLEFQLAESANKAEIIRDAAVRNGKYYIYDQYASGKKIMSGVYGSIDPWIEDGPFVYYHDEGEIYAEGNFRNGKMTGNWIFYDKGMPSTVEYSQSLEDLLNSKPDGDLPEETNATEPAELKKYVESQIHFPPRIMNECAYSLVWVNVYIDKEKK